jgi:hypothetical protein
MLQYNIIRELLALPNVPPDAFVLSVLLVHWTWENCESEVYLPCNNSGSPSELTFSYNLAKIDTGIWLRIPNLIKNRK